MSRVTAGNMFTTWLRVVLLFVGLTLLTFGTLAVFMTDNEAGTVSLVAAGLVAALLCLVGRMPLSVKVGTVEILMAEAVKAEDAGNVEAAEALKSAAERATRVDQSPPPSEKLSAPAYEVAVLKALSAAAGAGTRIALEAHHGLGAVDAILHEDGRAIAVEIRAGLSFRPAELALRLAAALRAEVLALDSVIVVVQADDGAPLLKSLRKEVASLGKPARVVGWLPHETSDRLATTIRELLTEQ